MKRKIYHFIVGSIISFFVEVMVMTITIVLSGSNLMPISLIYQALGLAVCCSIAGSIFYNDRLSFFLQTILIYIFSLIIVIFFSKLFGWGNYSSNELFRGKSFLIILITIFSAGYAVTMTFVWLYQNRKQKNMNEKLTEFKKKSFQKDK